MAVICRAKLKPGGGYPNNVSMSKLVVIYVVGFLFICRVSGLPTEDLSSNVNTSSIDTAVGVANGTTCECDGGGVPCEKNLTSTDCPNGRLISRHDCSCCFVCAKQLTESCNDKDAPCDSEYGLVCGSDQKCQAKTNCTDDTACSNDLMCVGGACADPCKVLPDVCREMKLTNGTCIVRNHRPICSCPLGQSVNSENACVADHVDTATECEMDGLTYRIGEKFYKESCAKVCECETSGSLNCREVEGHPDCKSGTVPLSKLGGEMTRACKLLIGHGRDFDGCCVPEQCANFSVPHGDVELQNSNVNNDSEAAADEISKVAREFKITDSPNNLGESKEGKGEPNKVEQTVMMPIQTESQHSTEEPSSSSSTSSSAEVPEMSSMQVMILQRTDHSAVIDLPTSDQEAILSIALTTELNKDPSNAQVWKEHKIPAGLPQITLSDLIPSTSYTLKYSANGKDSSAVQFITNEVGESPPSLDNVPSSSSRGGVGTATGRSMNIDDVTPTGSAVIAESTEATSDIKSSTSGSEELIADNGNKEKKEHEHHHHHEHPSSSSKEIESGELENRNESGSSEMTGDDAPHSSTSPSAKGCKYNGTSYEVGHEILNGCDEKCECLESGEVKCMERCMLPMFKKGAFAHDTMCFEEPSGVDECCVIIACARGSPAEAETRGVPPSASSEGSSSPSAAAVQPDGPSSTSKPEGCIFNNQTFEFGDEHFDGCNYKCRCENSGEFTCLPRCNYRRDEEKEIPIGCEIQTDPSDSCCQMLVCHGTPLESGTRKDEPTIPNDGCTYKNKSYARDEKFYDGCESQCMCFSNGDVTCQPRCPPAGPHGNDSCVTLEDPIDKCCKVTICGNQTLYDEVMKAEAARKLTTTTTAEPSTTPDSSTVSPATGIQRSMTSSEEMEGAVMSGEEHGASFSSSEVPPTVASKLAHELDIKISMVLPLNHSAMMVSVRVPEDDLATLIHETMIIKYSHDLTTWKEQEFNIKDLFTEGSEELHTVVVGLSGGQQYYFKALIKGFESNAASGITKLQPQIPPHEGGVNSEEAGSGSMEGHGSGSMENLMLGGSDEDDDAEVKVDSGSISSEGLPCKHKDKMYDAGQEFYDGCDAYCLCDGKGNVTCVEIDCPRDGRELIDESCVKWEPDLSNFRKEAPFCCPDMICVQHTHCELEGGYILQNFEEIPHKLTGCEKTCQCLYGNITCHPGNNCPTISEHPPAGLACPPELARQVPMLEDECCYQWACLNHTGHFQPPPPPFGLRPHPGSQHPNDATQVSNIIIQPLNESTLQIDFTVSPILVGLHGHVEVLYTKDFSHKPNPAQWESKVFQQAEDLIDNTHLQLFLTSLEPDTDYHMQIKVVVMAQFQPTSDVLLVRTPAPSIPTTTLPPEILVDPEIQLATSGSRSVKLHWKRFDDYDTLIDGVQIAYKESEDKVYQTTPLIHRTVTEYELTNLKPDKDYEVNLLFIPFHTDQKTILKSEKPIFIKTDKEEDEYAFDVALSPGKVSENSVELKVAGVPIPEEKYVLIYQVFYSSDTEKEQKNYFKVPQSDTTKRATLKDLRPGTKYTIWLEALLSNGKKKRSNVIDVMTKAGQLPSPEKSEQETLQESKPELPQTSSYYGALVALAIVAAMSILGIIALLMILIKKQNQAKAPINDRKSESSYDNPSFKSYDVESNGHIKPSEL